MSIQPYIDLGWHTVPLAGELKRLEDGKKTLPKFEENWRSKYQELLNKKASKLGGVITGKVSNIIAVDCDNAATWELFKTLDPTNEFLFISKGKGYEAGTLIYEYTEELPQNFTIHEDGIDLDFYSNQGFVYLATEANETKEHLVELPVIKPIPKHIVALLTRLHKSTLKVFIDDSKQHNNLFTANFLAPLVTQFVKGRGEYMPGLFRVITPKQFRNYDSYLQNGQLHPNEINDGDGSTYLVQVSSILGADFSINQELYTEAMVYINDLFDDPMDQKRLDSTILNPMINKKSSVDGKPIWNFDPEWESYRSIFITKDQSTVEVVYDDVIKRFFVVDSSRAIYTSFSRDAEMFNHLHAMTATPLGKKDIVKSIPLVRSVTHPHKPFGFNQGNDSTKRDFNRFQATPALSVFYNPKDYAHKYKRPEVTLKFFESLVPDEHMRTYLLSFLKTKLIAFKYSPVILYFLGVPGSGKGTFVRLVEEIFSTVPSPTAAEFLDKFNGWAEGAYFVELDEYGDTLSTLRDKEEAMGKLKAFTGKRKVDIRRMREDSYQYEHNITFIMSANKNPLMLDDRDRRIALFNTPNVLIEQRWVDDLGGIDVVYNELMDSILDFCYYLATEVKALQPGEYMRPPMFDGKFELVADSMPAAGRIAYCLKERQVDYLVELALDYACDNLAKALPTGTIMLSDLEDLYMEITSDKGNRRTLIKTIRDNGNVDMKRGGTDGVDFTITGYLDGPFGE
jgi:hypothetical protein